MKKLRNAGGIESYFEDDTAAYLLGQNSGWEIVAESSKAPAPAEAPAPDAADAPNEEEAPKAKKPKK